MIAVASGCAQSLAGVGTYSGLKSAPDANLKIKGLKNGKPTDVDRIAGNAIDEIEKYWTTEYPKVFNGKKYKKVTGGLYSVDPDSSQSIPCAGDASAVKFNAFYCPSADVVAWDRVGLFPALKEKFGTFPIAMVLAHEWGHAIQARSNAPDTKTIVLETQADCYAGAWTRAARSSSNHFEIDRKSLDDALGGYLLFRDPVGSDPDDRRAHGNAFDRVSAFQEGFEQGPEHCKGFDDTRQFTETAFTRPDDANTNGNLPYDRVFSLGQPDIEAFWAKNFKTMFGKEWKSPKTTAFDGGSDSKRPSCAGKKVTRAVEYCADDNTIFYDDAQAFKRVYVKTGDFGPMTMLAVAYSQAVRSQLGKDITGGDPLMSSICLAGVYAGQTSQKPPGSDGIALSPGDLDEAVQALLTYGGTFFGVPSSAGFARISSFRQGFMDVKNCTGLK